MSATMRKYLREFARAHQLVMNLFWKYRKSDDSKAAQNFMARLAYEWSQWAGMVENISDELDNETVRSIEDEIAYQTDLCLKACEELVTDKLKWNFYYQEFIRVVKQINEIAQSETVYNRRILNVSLDTIDFEVSGHGYCYVKANREIQNCEGDVVAVGPHGLTTARECEVFFMAFQSGMKDGEEKGRVKAHKAMREALGITQTFCKP